MHETTSGFCTLLVAGMLVAHATPATAACEAKSGAGTVALIELYTSEGCNSCPPADRWIADLPRRGFGPDRVVPLALHVDYWNDLGWIDPFAQSQFTQRQREFARRTNARTVYTPEFVLSGREYRRWSQSNFSDKFSAELDRINRTPARADIRLRLERTGQRLRVGGTASVKQEPARAAVYLALYENNLHTEVRAGENRGHTLPHNFVVRRLIGPIAFDSTANARLNEQFTIENDWKFADLGVAAFVQGVAGTDILQALALPTCR